MKKLTTMLLLLCLVVTSFAGCGNNSASKDDGKIMTINWMPQNDAPIDADSPITKIIEDKFGVKINYVYLDRSKETELLNIRIAAGEIPDVMRRNDSSYRTLIKEGALSEIPEDLIKETAPKLYDYTTQYGGDDMWTIAKQDGKLYGMPILENNGQYHYVSIWRDDWLRNVGINKIPETLEEAEDAFYKFVNNDPDGNGKKDTYALSANGLNAIYNAYGAHPAASYWALRDGKTVLSATLPEMKEALTKLNKWYNDGLIDPEFITGENKGQHFSSSVVFWNGRIGFSVPGLPYHVYPPFYDGKVAGSLNYKSFKEIQGENATFEYGVPLKGPEGKSGAESWGVFAGNFFVMGRDVGSGSEKMKKILEINEVLNTDYDFFLQTKFGREGTEYTNDNGLITSLLDTDQRRTLGLSTQGIQYMINNLEFIQNSETPESVEFSKKHGDIPGVEHYTKLVWGGLPSDSMYKSIIEQKVAENYSAFITGERDISEFELFVEELNNAGLAQLTAEAQEWYDARYTK